MHISFNTPPNPIIPTSKIHQLNETYCAKTVLKNNLKRSSKSITFQTPKTDRIWTTVTLCVPCPLREPCSDTKLMRNRGWLRPWLCKDECRAEALMITTNNTTKWSWKEHETTTNRTKNSVLDFLMLITCDPPLWSTRKRYVQSFPDLALEVSLKYQGCSATLNTRRIKGYSVAFDEVASNFREEENRKLFSEYLSITLINLKYKLLNVFSLQWKPMYI